ncbi:LytR/AlgR family response regulator transcription factor [Glaciecola petra]|uniref:LytTR family DNA-binding domain-containing protein n=1 Tax=Glaciecola petra TaxID=3075602 RepID=A0ABU2ZP64_9ALTE|nr:LytTR family DNA-binding domain-containing protein [Aestuariibacter sp. P117]MDT0594421.1 LytTR family DNA-binding domain-containing protein [Aestuariibacter sp. P117]
MKRIKTVIVDDEPLARQGLIFHIARHEQFEIVCECADGHEGLEAIKTYHPDVMFVDIEMPKLNGIELASIIHKRSTQDANQAPKIVFVTAFKDYALEAFEFEAFDYLLKPYAEERVDSCLNKLQKVIGEENTLNLHGHLDKLISRKTGESLLSFMQRLEASKFEGMHVLQHTISLKSGNEWVRVQIDSIMYIEAAGDYMCVHTHDGTHIIRKTLKQFEQELSQDLFVRVSRSAIVNLAKVQKLVPNSNGEYLAVLSSGDEVKVTRAYKQNLSEFNEH